jgi:hypothetical protein
VEFKKENLIKKAGEESTSSICLGNTVTDSILQWRISPEKIRGWKDGTSTLEGTCARHVAKVFGYLSRLLHIRGIQNYDHIDLYKEIAVIATSMHAAEHKRWLKPNRLAREVFCALAKWLEGVDESEWTAPVNASSEPCFTSHGRFPRSLRLHRIRP